MSHNKNTLLFSNCNAAQINVSYVFFCCCCFLTSFNFHLQFKKLFLLMTSVFLFFKKIKLLFNPNILSSVILHGFSRFAFAFESASEQ